VSATFTTTTISAPDSKDTTAAAAVANENLPAASLAAESDTVAEAESLAAESGTVADAAASLPAESGTVAEAAASLPAKSGTVAEAESAAKESIVHKPQHTIAVMHASVGSGHRVAAEAIKQALEHINQTCTKQLDHFPGRMNIELFDVLDFARIPISGDKTATMFIGPTRPIYDLTWRYWLTGRLLWSGGTAWSRVMFPAFTRWVRETKPVAIITTHITAANIAVGARMITRQRYPVICVPTDYEVEGMWPHRYADLFCVGTESMAETLRARKVPEERIMVTGIPARNDFRAGYNRTEVRREWNIPQNKKIALVLAGANLPTPYKLFREILRSAMPRLKAMNNLHLIFLTGKDCAYADELKATFAIENMQNVIALGYTTDVARLMAASDFCICKPGGLTVTECLCSETPMLLVGRAYGQEKSNARLLTSLGAALHVQTSRELVEAIRYMTTLESALDAMRSTEDYLRKPDAAIEIAMASLQAAFATVDDDTLTRWRKRPFMSFYWGHQPAHTR
jgi:processive 1,2-diacylglycerol beta-glucosyltransferase